MQAQVCQENTTQQTHVHTGELRVGHKVVADSGAEVSDGQGKGGGFGGSGRPYGSN